LIGGSDIVEQMLASGELQSIIEAALGRQVSC
jgi:glutaredoxin-related protein